MLFHTFHHFHSWSLIWLCFLIAVNHFTFEIVEGNEENKFQIDPSARTILVNKKLDYDYPVMDRNVSVFVRPLATNLFLRPF